MIVASPDGDFRQLIGPRITLLRPVKVRRPDPARPGAAGSRLALYGEAEFAADFPGLAPPRYVDYLALKGDPGDNIPGVRGVGPKTALRLLQACGDVEGVLRAASAGDAERLRTARAPKRVLAALAAPEGADAARLSRRLVSLAADLRVPATTQEWAALRPRVPEGDRLRALEASLDRLALERRRAQLRQLWEHHNAYRGETS